MKDKLTIISDDLNRGIITEKEARAKLFDLLIDSDSLPNDDAVYRRAYLHYTALNDNLTQKEVAEICFVTGVDYWHYQLTGNDR